MLAYSSGVKPDQMARQLVIAASAWTKHLKALMSAYMDQPILVIACAIEAALRASVDMVSLGLHH